MSLVAITVLLLLSCCSLCCGWHARLTYSLSTPACQCRRGAAYGLAGIVKGLGVSAVNGFGIMDALKAALDDQSSADGREGALFAFESLCEKLGR